MRSRIEQVDRESKGEAEACRFAELRGWMVIKIMMCNIDSMPDRLFMRKGRVIFIEFKKSGESARKKQAKRHREIREHGVEVYVCDSADDAKELLK